MQDTHARYTQDSGTSDTSDGIPAGTRCTLHRSRATSLGTSPRHHDHGCRITALPYFVLPSALALALLHDLTHFGTRLARTATSAASQPRTLARTHGLALPRSAPPCRSLTRITG